MSALIGLFDRRAASDEDFRLHFVAHQWALATSLAINSREDFLSLPKLNVDPFEHQVNSAITFFRRLCPRGMIADDVGLGKTITAGLILAELIKRRRVKSFLVLCPKLIMDQWKEELQSKFNLEAYPLTGQAFRYNVNKNSLITTYDTARNYMDRIKERGFDLLILDEAHKVRSLRGVEKPALRAVKLNDALKEGAFKFVLQLTATPLQTSIWDVYSLVDILRAPQSNPLGPEIDFESQYLAPFPNSKRINPRALRPEMREDFRRRLSEVMIRTRRRDTKLPFPEREVRTHRLKAASEEREFVDQAVRWAAGSGAFEKITLMRAALSSPAAASLQMENKLKDGKIDDENAERVRELIEAGRGLKRSVKVEQVIKLVEELRRQRPQDWRVVIFTSRIETLAYIRSTLQESGIKEGVGFIQGARDASNRRAIEDYSADPPRVHAIVSTDAGAEGVNLQAGNVVVNYDLPWNPMVLEQRIGRVQRLGQKAKNVIVYNLVIEDTVEERVVARLMERLHLFETAIGEMEAILSQIGGDEEDEDSGESMERMILRLVLKSLENQDASQEIEAKRQSVEKARKLMEEVHQDIETALGKIDPDQSGPIMPRLDPIKPDMSLREFTLAALTAGKGTVELQPDGMTFVVSSPARGEFGMRITFNPDHPMFEMDRLGAAAVTLYAEGERAFEHLVHEWMSKGQALAIEGGSLDDDGAKALLAVLLGERGLKVDPHELAITRRVQEVLPAVSWKINISVFHDQYEKILTTRSLRSEHGFTEWPDPGPVQDQPSPTPTPAMAESLARIASRLKEGAEAAAKADRDIGGFSGFYEGRLREQLARHERFWSEKGTPTVRERGLEKAQREDLYRKFRPETRSEPIACKAFVYEVVIAEVLRQMGPSTVRVPVEMVSVTRRILTPWVSAANGSTLTAPAICLGAHLVNQADLQRCSEEHCGVEACVKCRVTALRDCKDCRLGYCDNHRFLCSICKEGLCLRHARTAEDQATVCDGCTGVCEETGARLPVTALGRCVVSNALVRRDLLVASAVSGQLALRKNLVNCQESNQPALPGELKRCAVSGKLVLPSLLAKCPDSGEEALRTLLVPCAESGVEVVPQALGVCQETNKKVRKVLLDRCQVTDATVLKSLLATSAVTGKRALGRLGEQSVVSGKWALSDELLRCEATSKPALPEELVFCSVSGKRVLPELTGKCCLTGRVALKDYLAPSAVSGKVALKSELKRCEETGRLALPAEVARCEESGKTVLLPLLDKCPSTGKRALPQYFATSELSGKRVLKSALVKCDVTGKVALPDELATCQASQKRVVPSLLRECDISQQMVLPEYLAKSELSGRHALKEHVFLCPSCERTCLSDERKPCESCKLTLCRKCVDGRMCQGCTALLSDNLAPVGAAAAPPVLVRAWPKAARWKYHQCGTLHYGIGIPPLFSVFVRKRLVVTETRPGAGTVVVCDRPL